MRAQGSCRGRQLSDMLILTRKVGEKLMVGNDVIVTIVGVKANQVRIGVNAPKDLTVHRQEVYERLRRDQNRARLT